MLEYLPVEEETIFKILDKAAVPYQVIGKTKVEKRILFSLKTQNSELKTVLDEDMRVLRDIWEETSHQLDLLQRNPENIREERKNIYDRKGPSFVIPFTPAQTSEALFCAPSKPKVAVIREEGSNGDREMVSAFFLAGFEPWDVTVTDLLEGRITLDQFRGSSLRRRVQLCRRARLGQRLGSVHPVQQEGLGPVRKVLPPQRYLQPRRMQRVPAHGAFGLGSLAEASPTSFSLASSITSPAASNRASLP